MINKSLGNKRDMAGQENASGDMNDSQFGPKAMNANKRGFSDVNSQDN